MRFLEGAAQGSRRLNQLVDLVQQGLIQFIRPTRLDRQADDLVGDRMPADFGIEQDPLGSQSSKIFLGSMDFDFCGAQEAQATRDCAGLHPGIFEGHHLPTQQSQQPADRPRKIHVAGIPAHGFIKLNRSD